MQSLTIDVSLPNRGEAAKLKKLTEFPDFYDSEYYSYTLSEVDPDPRRKVDLFELGLIAANCQLQLMVKLNSYPPGTRGPGTPLEDTDFSCSAVDASEKIVTITRAPGATDPLQFIRMSVVLRDMLHVFSALNEQQSEYNDGVMDVYEKTVDEHARPTRLLMKVSVVTFDGKFNAPPPRQIA